MYLKRLELQGFKSFADKTVLEFGRGVTTVVGPNGSGKSNISDAVRWVMGEMSAKSLRGSNMQDVIFAGTEIRKQVNFAEVSLILDNSDKAFDIDYDEVVVTRKVFRSGESVYQINRSDCRLKDIHELFMDTGLGRDGYSMIGQGNVSQILSTKAEDRRSFFEEAAGVSKYKYRKDEALRKLSSVNENLVRINDIVSELERQIGPLEQQSKKARKYLGLYEEYKKLDVGMSLVNIVKNAEGLKKANELYESISSEIDDLKLKGNEIEQKRNELYLMSSKKDEEQSQKNNELIENEAKSMTAVNDISMAQNDIKNNLEIVKRINEEILLLNMKNNDAKEKIQSCLAEIGEKEALKKELLDNFEQIQKTNNEVFSSLSSLRTTIDELQAEVIEKMNEASSVKAKISGIENLRQSFLQRREAVEEEIKNCGVGLENIKTEIEKNTETLTKNSEKLESMKKRVEDRQEVLKNSKIGYEENQKELSELQVSLNSKISQKKILEGMENDYEGFSKSVKAVMTSPELKKASVYGTVSGLIDVKREYVTAIEIALGGAMQNIVVESEDDAKVAIEYLKREKAGRATFLPLSAVSARSLDNIKEISKMSGFVGVASELVSYDKKYDVCIKNLLGRVVVADTMDSAVEISKKFGYKFKIVTKAGELLNAGGSISGGSINNSSGFLSRAAKIKELGEEISGLNSKVSELLKKNQEFEEDIKNANTQLSTYLPLLREYENDILVAKNTLEHLESLLAGNDSSKKALDIELVQIEEQLKNSSDDVAKLINEERKCENKITELNNLILEKESEHEKISQDKEAQSTRLMEETLKIREIDSEIENKNTQIKDLNLSIDENNISESVKSEEKSKLLAKNEEFEVRIVELNAQIEGIKQQSVKIKEEIEEIDAQKQSIVEGLKGITNSDKELTDKLITLQQELSKTEAKKVKLEEDSSSIINHLWDEYELGITAAEEMKIEIEDEKEARGQLSELKGKIKALGSVNVNAIDEYETTKERFDFLVSQKTDLEKSQDNLTKVIASMQELMEEHFKEQFDEINKAFSRVFNELFVGGKGRLYLSNPQEVMDSGIEIEVQLPGKGLQNINLYSGGEKSFIAIALLFAILEVKPTPFCFLDEIDAALDDVNVARFATYLKNYLTNSQFIVITHRRGTMEAANMMYGVTMQEKGVSKLLSLQIDDVEESMLK